MKLLVLIVTLALRINSYAQEDKIVTIVVSGQGKTQDEFKTLLFIELPKSNLAKRKIEMTI